MAEDRGLKEAIETEDRHPVDEPVVEPEEKKWRTPGFQKMRLDWSSRDRDTLSRIKGAVERRMQQEFKEVYVLLNDFYNVVRTQEVDPDTGEMMTDQFGYPIWKRGDFGRYEEDFTKLSRKEQENFMYVFTTRLFTWQQSAADIWGEAMYAKAQWEERFALGFNSVVSGTIDDHVQAGRLDALEERYFALFTALLSRKAEALVRSIELIAQRLKDSMTL